MNHLIKTWSSYDSILYLIRFQQRIVFDIKDRTSFDFMQKCENYRVKGNDGCTGWSRAGKSSPPFINLKKMVTIFIVRLAWDMQQRDIYIQISLSTKKKSLIPWHSVTFWVAGKNFAWLKVLILLLLTCRLMFSITSDVYQIGKLKMLLDLSSSSSFLKWLTLWIQHARLQFSNCIFYNQLWK